MRMVTGSRVALAFAALVVSSATAAGDPAEAAEAATDEAIAETQVAAAEHAVVFRGETLFFVRAPIGDLDVAARSDAIEDRLLEIAAGDTDVLDGIRVVPKVSSHDVMAGDRLVTSVLDADAGPTGRTRAQLAADYTAVLRVALAHEFRSRSAQGLALGAAKTLAATVLLAVALRLVGLARRRAASALAASVGTRIHALRLRGFTVLSAARLAAVLTALARTLSYALIAVFLYFYLQSVLGSFAWTRGMADQLVAFGRGLVAWAGGGVWSYLPNLFYIAAIVVATRFVIRGLRFFFSEIDQGALSLPGFYREWAIPTYKLVRLIALAFALVVVFPYLPGSGSPAFQGVSVFVGVLFSLGSASAVGNAVAGVVLTYMRPFRDGDRVRIADTVGDVIDKDLFVVRIRTIKNVEITIPNAMVLANHIVNFSAEAAREGLILHTEVTIGYDVPWRRVHELLIAATREIDGILAAPPPFVLQTKLSDFYVHYELNAHTDRPTEMAKLYARLHERIQDEFAAAGVEIMSPHYAAARDGNTIALPEEHWPAGYEAGAFRVTDGRRSGGA